MDLTIPSLMSGGIVIIFGLIVRHVYKKIADAISQDDLDKVLNPVRDDVKKNAEAINKNHDDILVINTKLDK